MSDEYLGKSPQNLAVIIAITALVLALVSGVVNYRQNNLAGLESSLRDTKDQLQLAKNDITDIKLKTIQQLVDAELAIKAQAALKKENAGLREALGDAQARVADLEARIRTLDNRLTATSARRSSRSTAAGKHTASAPKVAATAAAADLDIYMAGITPEQQQLVNLALESKGFKGKYPPPSKTMSMANSTTIFYYDRHYKAVAEQLLATLTRATGSKVVLRKGSSPFAANKIIVHLIGR